MMRIRLWIVICGSKMAWVRGRRLFGLDGTLSFVVLRWHGYEEGDDEDGMEDCHLNDGIG